MPRPADERAPGDHLMLGRVLADDEQAGGAIQPASVEHGPPFHPEVLGREHRPIGHVSDQRVEGFQRVTGVTGCRLGVLLL
jgi:hypothetical protein